jgi:archaellum biogenesis protein FlaJ (TadC family)
MYRPFFRRILIILGFIGFFFFYSSSQVPVKTYDPEWKKINDFVSKGLPKSALEEVQKLFTLAKQEKQDAQVIKTLVFMAGLQTENRENNEILSIANMEKEITVSSEPARSILNSLLADMYWYYYNSHRWQLYNRTQTANFKKEDIATWGAEDFHKKIGDLYLQSIKNERIL